MTRTLVTGAAGFTGRYLATTLAARGHEVHGLVQSAPLASIPDVSAVHAANLTDRDEMSRIIEAVRPDHVVHLAAIAFVAHGDVAEMYRSNVVGTRILLDALARSPTPMRSIILASSANVYGNARSDALDEQTPIEPANDYGVTKAAMELVAGLFEARLPLIIARPFNYTGRGQSADFLIPKIVSHARARSAEVELGNLDVARDFSDVRNVVEAYAALLDAPDAVGETFNISSGHATSLREVVNMVEQISGHQLAVRVNPAFVRANEVRTMCGSSSKLFRVIGHQSRIPLADTLAWMLGEG